MKKNRVIALILSIIMIVGFAASCSNEAVKVEDQLAYVSFGNKASRSFTTGISDAPGVESLYWTYDAVKVGGGLNTGAVSGGKFSGKGITGKQVGPFSVGSWKFTLKGYAEETCATLVYSGTSETVPLNAGINNPINVDVVYQAKGGEGQIVVDKAYLDYSGTETITKLQIDLEDTADSTNKKQWMLTDPTTNTEGKNQFSKVAEKLSAGVYKATFSFFTVSGESGTLALPPFDQYIVVLNNRTTTISGCISEDQALNQTFNVTKKDEGFIESVGKYYVYVNTEEALQNAMNAAGKNENSVVVLTGDIETESITVNTNNSRSITIGLSKSVTLDLNGFNLKKSATSTAEDLISMSATDLTLKIKNSRNTGSIDAGSSTVAKVTSGKLVIESGELKGETALKVEAGAEAEILGGKLIGVSTALEIVANTEETETSAKVVISGNAEVTTTNATGSVAIKNGGTLEMDGGKISSDIAIEITDNNASTSVTGGSIEASTPVSKGEDVDSIPDDIITGDVDIFTYVKNGEELIAAFSNSSPKIILSNDITLSNTITVKNGKEYTIDLNGKTITATLSNIKGINSVIDTDNSSLILKDSVGTGKIISDEYGISASNGGTITIERGTIEAEYAVLSGNNTTGDMNFFINGGTLTSKKSEAIYMPGQQTLTITDGTINGGISARMGQISISGGEINGMTSNQEADSFDQYWNYSGSAWIGDAIYVWGGTYTSNNTNGNSCNITITGGTINGNAHRAIAVYDIANKYDQTINVKISGDAVVIGDIVEDHTKDQGTNNVETTWTIEGGSFTDLASAIEYVSNDSIIKLADNAVGNGIKVPSGKSFTVDFDGHTYDINGELVGSSGTETNSLQLLKDSSITFKNGKLTSTSSKYQSQILIQNYSNLTLDNMTVEAGLPFDYILSNNNGNVLIKDTTITAAEGKVAFDVCRYSSYSGPEVTVEGNSVINGKVEISSSGAKEGSTHKLNVTGGTFNGEITKSNSPDFIGNITGGTFSFDPSNYLAKNCIVNIDNGKYVVSKLSSRSLSAEEKNTIDPSGLFVDGLEVYVIETGKYSLSSIVADKMIFIPSNNTVEIDLVGNCIESTFSGFSIANCGNLTITDSSTGKTGLVFNSTVNCGGTDIYNNNTGSYYYGHDAIRNFGTLIIKGGTFGDCDTDQANANGTTYGAAVRNQSSGTVTIDGGNFTCVDNYGKFSDGGSVYSYALRNFGTMTINDASVYGKMNGGVSADNGSITVNGGRIIIDNSNSWHTFTINSAVSPLPTITIYGGYFVNNNTKNGHLLSEFNGMPSWGVGDNIESNGYYIYGGTFIEDEQQKIFGTTTQE